MAHQGYCTIIYALFLICATYPSYAQEQKKADLMVNASTELGRKIPDKLFGIFFEEINHAGTGGIWAELVSNRGFEAGPATNKSSNIDPWSIVGNQTNIIVSIDTNSCFQHNKIALRMEVLCDIMGSNICPLSGVGIYNPGFWGMNIEKGKTYNAVIHVMSSNSLNLSVSLTSPDGSQILASKSVIKDKSQISNWTKVELQLQAAGTNSNARLQLTTQNKGVMWLDQISLMPTDTYKGHGFRKELISMVEELKPGFFRFPGGCFVEGQWLTNAYRWKETVGPWEERPGHYGDVWTYWTDDGVGYLEFLQLAEDLDTSPIWVINNGVSHNDSIPTKDIAPYVQEILESIEFARGSANSTWGSLRAKMGHPEPFEMNFIAIGNEDCWKPYYKGNYVEFYNAIKKAYPDIKLITNCDGSTHPLDHPADLYDYHVYTDANRMFAMANTFDTALRTGPKAFVSEYAVYGPTAGNGSLLGALGEAGFLIGLEKNSDVVELACYAPLFVNTNDRSWIPDAITFDSSQQYASPSYWIQVLFRESNGATLFPSQIQADPSIPLAASSITWQKSGSNATYLKIKIVNFGSDTVNLNISVAGLKNTVSSSGSTKTTLTSGNQMDENSFSEPKKVAPAQTTLENAGQNMALVIPPHSFTSLDLQLTEAKSSITKHSNVHRKSVARKNEF